MLPLSPLQSSVTSSLDYIEAQQAELASVLDAYEAQLPDLVDQSALGANASSRGPGAGAGAGAGGGSAEKEREGAYKLAAHLSNSLDTTSSSLVSLIQTLNALSPSALSPSGGAADATSAGHSQAPEVPLAQIAAILNAHLGSLQWIEGSTDALRRAVRDLEGRVAGVQGRVGGARGGR